MSENITVMLLHNHSDQAELILQMLNQLQDRPFQVDIVPPDLDATSKLLSQKPDLILLDLNLISENSSISYLLRTNNPDAVFVLLLEGEEELTQLNSLGLRSNDYLLKDELSPRLLELTLRCTLERKRSQNILRKTQGRLQFIIDSIQDFAIFSTDLNGLIDFWNAGAEHIFGYSEAEIVGRHGEILFIPEDRAQDVPARELRQAIENGWAADERWHMRKDGSRFYASGITRPLYDDRQNLIGFTKVARDLTERQIAQEQRDNLLKQALESRTEAEQSSRLKEEFLAMIAHEVRTPLASIVGFASMMTSKTMIWPHETMIEYATIIEEEAQRASGLVEQLTDRARQQTGKLNIETQKISLEAIIQSAMSQLRALTSHHRLLIDLPKDLPRIEADPHRIAQVLINLVSNAARYSQPQTQIILHAQIHEHDVQVDVIDEGRGIPAEQRDKVFDPFHQVDGSSTKGLGLGLALCKDLVERHRGRIWIQGDNGSGTVMSFTLPIAE